VPVEVRYITDPACSASWAAEPKVRKLMTEFGGELHFTWVMGGLARDYTAGYQDPSASIGGGRDVFDSLLTHWLGVAGSSRMPIDPLLWLEGPIRTTYPACMAVKAAQEHAADGGYRYLRTVREGLLCFRRKLDTEEALVDEARRARLDVARFRIDLESNATLEAFGRDLDETRNVPDEARLLGKAKQAQGGERVVFPTAYFVGEGGSRRGVYGDAPYEDYREAAIAAGARPAGQSPPTIEQALRRFDRMALIEVEAVCELPTPRAAAELWRLALEWRVKPVRVLTGTLWEHA
jgi:putative protein-disulfide isomerase